MKRENFNTYSTLEIIKDCRNSLHLIYPKPRGSEQYHVIMGRSSDLRIILLTAPSHPAINLTFISIILRQPKHLGVR
jgi:hypothetical protein